MTDPLVNGILLFVLSCALGYAVTKVLDRLRPIVPIGSKVRLRMAGGVARSVLVAQRPNEWVFGALLTRFAGELPQPGENVLVEAPGTRGAYLFRVRVKSVDPEPFGLYVEPPAMVHKLNRRQERRVSQVDGPATLNGSMCQIQNLSAGGAQLLTADKPSPGDRVAVSLGDHQVGAWVLASREVEGSQTQVRVCFDEEVRV